MLKSFMKIFRSSTLVLLLKIKFYTSLNKIIKTCKNPIILN